MRRLRANRQKRQPGTSRERNWLIPVLTVVGAGLFSLAGACIGTSLQNRGENQLEVAKARNAALAELYKFQVETNDYPEELLTAQRASKVVSYITLATPGTIHSIADVLRKNQGCTDLLKSECQVILLREVQVERSELGIEAADFHDLSEVLKGPLQAMGQVARGRSDSQLMLISPNIYNVKTDDLPILKDPLPAAFESKFPPNRFVIAAEGIIVDDNRLLPPEKNLYTVCVGLAGVSIQPARGFNPRIPIFRTISDARIKLTGKTTSDAKHNCLVEAMNDAVTHLVSMDPTKIPIK